MIEHAVQRRPDNTRSRLLRTKISLVTYTSFKSYFASRVVRARNHSTVMSAKLLDVSSQNDFGIFDMFLMTNSQPTFINNVTEVFVYVMSCLLVSVQRLIYVYWVTLHLTHHELRCLLLESCVMKVKVILCIGFLTYCEPLLCIVRCIQGPK